MLEGASIPRCSVCLSPSCSGGRTCIPPLPEMGICCHLGIVLLFSCGRRGYRVIFCAPWWPPLYPGFLCFSASASPFFPLLWFRSASIHVFILPCFVIFSWTLSLLTPSALMILSLKSCCTLARLCWHCVFLLCPLAIFMGLLPAGLLLLPLGSISFS